MNAHSRSRCAGSSAAEGSSSSSSGGSPSSPTAMLSRWRLPPESLPVSSSRVELGQLQHPRHARSSAPARAARTAAGSRARSASSRPRRAAAPSPPPAGRARRRRAPGCPRGSAAASSCPRRWGRSSPSRSPGAAPKETSRSACLSPKRLPIPATFIRARPPPPRPPRRDRRARSRTRGIPARRPRPVAPHSGSALRSWPAAAAGRSQLWNIEVPAQVDDRLAHDRGDRERDERAHEARDLPAEQQREDHQDRVDPQRLAEDVRRHDVALELLQRGEGDDQPDRVDRVVAERGDHDRREARRSPGRRTGSAPRSRTTPRTRSRTSCRRGRSPASRARTASARRSCP